MTRRRIAAAIGGVLLLVSSQGGLPSLDVAAWAQQAGGAGTLVVLALAGLLAAVALLPGTRLGELLGQRPAMYAALGFLVCLLALKGPALLPTDWKLPSWLNLPDIPWLVPAKPTAVTYVYEKDSGGIPSGVAAAISKLNAQGILATSFEEDTVDSSGDVPDQYKVALPAAREKGLPALVVMAGERVVRVVKVATEAETLEASK